MNVCLQACDMMMLMSYISICNRQPLLLYRLIPNNTIYEPGKSKPWIFTLQFEPIAFPSLVWTGLNIKLVKGDTG